MTREKISATHQAKLTLGNNENKTSGPITTTSRAVRIRVSESEKISQLRQTRVSMKT